MKRLAWFGAGAVALMVAAGLGAFVYLKTGADGFTARAKPGGLERWAAKTARTLALPSGVNQLTNPVPNTPDVLADARAHWADHCATCHANNGSGDTEVGKHLYPPAPDMRSMGTQQMSDGELFYIIQNGVRLTGMPAWGTGTAQDARDSWKLVRFIRHLPQMTPEEASAMEALNPKTPDELKEEQEERQFLNGDSPDEPKHK